MAGAPIQIPGVEILAELGHGTHSVVYKVRRGDGLYALKVPLRSETGIKLQILGRRFRREAVALARLRHPLLPRVMEVGMVGRSPYMIMELAVGRTLAEHLAAGPLTQSQVIQLGRQLAGALEQVHQSGLVHRDVKPRNIILDGATGQVKLVDFGFAASIDAAFRILEPVGTLEYAAPEQVSGLRQRVDGRADLYAVGCVLYECLTGRPPFTELDPKRLLYQHQGLEIPDVREVCPGVSAALSSILTRLLARVPDDRYPSAEALLFDLDHIEDLQSGKIDRPAFAEGRVTSAPVPMLGRSREFSQLRRAWTAVEGGNSQAVLLQGMAGCGKTRLARSLVDHVTSGGRRMLTATCHAWDPRPFSAIREIIEGYAQIDRELSPEERKSVTQRTLDLAGDLAPLVRVLSPAMALMFAGAAPIPESQDAQHIFVEGLAEFLGKLFRDVEPGILFVDDLQWLDASSRRVLRRAMDRASDSRLLYLFATRGEPGIFPEVDRFFEGIDPEQLKIDRLDEADIVELIGAYLGDADLDVDLVRAVTQLSDGTPLSTLEILRMMFDEGHLLPSWGRWKFDAEAVAKMLLPQNTIGVLERRIASLDDMTRSTLSAAATVGMTFSDKLLPTICGLEEGHTTAALAEARRSMLVRATHYGTHRFVHDSAREVLLKGMTEKARRELHQRTAEAMDQVGPAGDDGTGGQKGQLRQSTAEQEFVGSTESVRPPPVREDPDADACYSLASHYARGVPARTPLRAHDTNMEAGRLAFHSFDNERALFFFQAAFEAATNLSRPLNPELEFLVGESKLRIGALDESLDRFRRVLSVTEDPVQQAFVLSRMAWVFQLQLDSAKAWESLNQAFEKLGKEAPTDSPRAAFVSWVRWIWSKTVRPNGVYEGTDRQKLEAVCSLYYQAARLASLDEKPLRIVQSALSGAVPAERLGPSTSLSRIYVTLAFVFTALGRRKTGRKYLSLAGDVARQMGDPVAIAHTLQIHCACAAWQGNIRDALEVGKRCLEDYGHWRELSEYCLIAYNQQLLLSVSGRSAEAWSWMERMIEKLAHHEGAPFLHELSELGAHAALAGIGREEESADRLTKLRQLTLRVPMNSGFRTMTYGPRIRLFTEIGDLGEGFEKLVVEFESNRFNPRRAHLAIAEYFIHVAHARIHLVLRATVAERAHRVDQLAAAVRDLRAAARVPLIRAHARVAEAYHAMVTGAVAKAERLFTQAEALGQQENAPWILYSVHRGRAHLLRLQGNDDAALDQARLAEALANQHGMAYRMRWIREEFRIRQADTPRRLQSRQGRFSTSSSSESWARRSDSSGRLQSLLRVVHGSGEDLDPARQARSILDDVVYSLRAQCGYLFLAVDETEASGESRSLKLLASRKEGERDAESPDALCWRLVGDAFDDWRSELRVPDRVPGAYLMISNSQRAIVVAPFSVGDIAKGVGCVERPIERGAFSEADGELLSALMGHVPVVLELANALSARFRGEEELRRAQKLDAMGRLAHGVALDFGRVLAEIRTSTDLLGSNSMNGSQTSVQTIRAAAARAEELTQQLAAFSKEGSSQAEPLNVNDRIRSSTSLLERLLGPSIALSVRAGAELCPIKASPGDVDQLFVTLAVRAREVMTGEGAVVVETSNVTLAEAHIKTHPTARPGRYVRISFSDTGRALGPEEQRLLFEPFTSDGDVSRSLALGGLYRNVVRAGGFIDIESIVGEGTTFRIYWPMTSERVERLRLTTGEMPNLPGGTETILLVEHEPLMAEALGRVLKGLGYRVLRANDGVEALKLGARRHLDIDMVIADIVLPGMNGLELGRELLKMRTALRVLYLSDPSDMGIGNRVGFERAELLQKPVHQDILATRVREVLDRRAMS